MAAGPISLVAVLRDAPPKAALLGRGFETRAPHLMCRSRV